MSMALATRVHVLFTANCVFGWFAGLFGSTPSCQIVRVARACGQPGAVRTQACTAMFESAQKSLVPGTRRKVLRSYATDPPGAVVDTLRNAEPVYAVPSSTRTAVTEPAKLTGFHEP